MRIGYQALLLSLCTLACSDEASGPTPEQLESREVAARQVCISERLSARAVDELQTLEQVMGDAGPVGFQRAYAHHAGLRLAVFAQLDSALNHSPTPEDSTRHDSMAQRIQIRAPTPESVEENVIRSYETNFAQIYNDADHPCNWQSELE